MMFRKICFATIAISLLISCNTAPSIHASDAVQKGPLGVFFAPHMEAGIRTANLMYQQKNWPRLVQMIDIAEQYNAKITLLFNPQWATYILKNPQKFDLIKDWQAQGHEVGLHYHMVTHGDWCGFTNREDELYEQAPHHQGTVGEMMDLMNALAAPDHIVSACIGPDIATLACPGYEPIPPGFIDEIDFPDEILYDIDGVDDGRTRPIRFKFNGRERFHLRHGVARNRSEVDDRLEEIATAEPDEIIGLVTHEHDYDPQRLNEIFQYLQDRQIQVQTVRDIMEKFRGQ